MSKYTYNKDYFKVIDSADKAYWLGFYMPMVVYVKNIKMVS